MDWIRTFQRGAAFIFKESMQLSLPMRVLIPFGEKDYYVAEVNDSPMLTIGVFYKKGSN